MLSNLVYTSLIAFSWRIRIVCLAGLVFGIPLIAHTETIDIRDGVRTYLYGNRFTGFPPTGDFLGWAMAFGDIDGDGYTDFLCSSKNSEGPEDTHGPQQDVYVIFGGQRAEMDSVYAVDAPGGADIVCYHAGFSLACADIDNDGYDDMIMAMGGVNVVFGGPRSKLRSVYNFLRNDPAYTPPDILISGSTALGGGIFDPGFNDSFKIPLRGLVACDLNGDGFGDIVAGNHHAANSPAGKLTGAAYIVFGRPREELPPQIDINYGSSLPHPDVIIWGEALDAFPGRLAVGDLDGDGIDDLLSSIARGQGEFDLDFNSGEIHGWWGKPQWQQAYYTQFDEFDFSFQGGDQFSLGWEIATGDLDGDGRDELISGSPQGNTKALPPGRLLMGEYRIFFGRPRDLWPRWGDAINLTDVLIMGAQTGDAGTFNGPQEFGIGFSLATGDRDGDRYEELLIGASRTHRPDGSRPGGAYVLRGRPRSEWDPFIDLRDGYDTIVYGVDYTGSPGYQYDICGFMTGMADIDGNGLPEMFIAAPFGDGPDNSINDAGEIYIIYDEGGSPPTHVSPIARAPRLSNYPNPFHQSTTFRFDAPAGETVSLTVYDARGREVARPLASTIQRSGETEVFWAARDATGQSLPAGVYFIQLRAGHESHSRKMLILR